MTQSFDVFFDLPLNKRLSKQSAGDLRRHRAHYDVTVLKSVKQISIAKAFSTMHILIKRHYSTFGNI